MKTLLKSSLVALAMLAPAVHLCACNLPLVANFQSASARAEAQSTPQERSMHVQYLEIVCSDVEATCSALSKVHGVTFSEPEVALGNARTAPLEGGGRISVRAPMAEHDSPIVRPYTLVEDNEASVKSAEKAGGEFAMRTTEIPGQGKFAIYMVADRQFGLWQTNPARVQARAASASKERSMRIQYLEVVTSDVDATCEVLAEVHGVTFGEPDAGLGNARTASLESGGMFGVRAPMAEQDMQIVRPYVLVEDIEAAVNAAKEAGGEIAMGATEIPGHGKFAIYFLAGTQFGLWETAPANEASR